MKKVLFYLFILINSKSICFTQNMVYNGDFEENKIDSMVNQGKLNFPDQTNYTFDSFTTHWNNLFVRYYAAYINTKLPKRSSYTSFPSLAYKYLKAFRNYAYTTILLDYTLTDSANPKLIYHTHSNGYIGSEYSSATGIYQKLNTNLIKDSAYVLSYRFQIGFKGYDAIGGNLISQIGVLFSMNNINSPIQYPINYFKSYLQDTFLDTSYSWRYLKYEFQSDSNYSYINFGNFQDPRKNSYIILPGNLGVFRVGPTVIKTVFSHFIDDVRLLPKWQYLEVTPDVYACENDSVELKVLNGSGGFKWATSNNPNIVLSNTGSLKIRLADTNIKYQVMSPYDTAVIQIYVSKNNYLYDTINYNRCENKSFTISVPNIYQWYDSSKDTTKSFSSSGIYWYETKNQCKIKHITVNISINNSKYDTLKQSACDSFILKNNTYKKSGVYTSHFITSSFCDSFHSLELNINQSKQTIINQFSCTSYLLDDSLYSISDTITRRYQTIYQCDSLVTLIIKIGLDNNILLQNGINYTAIQDSVSYQWYRCNPWRRISNETNMTFTTYTRGSYAVVLDNGKGCRDTSECIALYSSQVFNFINSTFHISPNPFINELNIEMDKSYKVIDIKIYDLTGRVIFNSHYKNLRDCDLSLESISKGIYYLQIETESNTHFFNILKE